jgi:hypothetical protein
MPYKDRNKQLACQRKWYHSNPNKKLLFNKHRAKYTAQKNKYILSVKAGGCVLCSEIHPSCLDFHHLDETNKSFNIGEHPNNGVGLKKLKEEVSKCILLCSNCHRKLHFARKSLAIE